MLYTYFDIEHVESDHSIMDKANEIFDLLHNIIK